MSKNSSGMANPNYTNALQEYDSFSELKNTSSPQLEARFQVNSGEEFKPSNKYQANVINKPEDEVNEEVVEEEDEGEPEWEMLDGEEKAFGLAIIKVRGMIYDLMIKPQIKMGLGILLLVLFPVYFGFAMKNYPPFSFPNGTNSSTIISDFVFSNNRGFALFMLTIIVAVFAIWELVKKFLIKSSNKADLVDRILPANIARIVKKYQAWIVISIVATACFAYLIYDLKDYYNLVSLLGLFTFIFICVLISEYPSRINLRALVVGILIQYILGVFILRSELGFQLFKFLGNQVSTFLDYTNNGCKIVFGETFEQHFFAFKAMPVVIFFSAIVNILYYFGAIQFVLLKIAWTVNFLMGTSPTESVNSVANVFLGPSEAPLLIKPFLPKMTESELFAVMVAAFSTVSGSVLAAYIGFGVPPDHLLTAGLMSAPASLAIAKTIFPETRKTNATFDAIRNVKTKKYNNVFEAISVGAIDMLTPVGCIIANLIAFVSIFAFLNQICVWLFSMMALENFGIANILQYLFWPFALLMGVDPEDCRSAAMLVGTKVFVNELVAYTELGNVVKFRDGIMANGTYELYRNGTLPIPSGYPMLWNDRSIVIITYALCGFANFGTIGIEIATLSVFAPTRSKVFLRNAAKAMLAGNFSSFMNACIAGLLFKKI